MTDQLIWHEVTASDGMEHHSTDLVDSRIPFYRQSYQVTGSRREGFLVMAGDVGLGTVRVTFPTLDDAKAWCQTRYNDDTPEFLPAPPANPAGRQLVWSHPRTETTPSEDVGERERVLYESAGDVPGELFAIAGWTWHPYPETSWQASIRFGDGPTTLGDGEAWVATLQEAENWCEWVRLVHLIRGSVAIWDAFRGAAVKNGTMRLIRDIAGNTRTVRDPNRAGQLRWQSNSHTNPTSYWADLEPRGWRRRSGGRYSVTYRRGGGAEWIVRPPGSGEPHVFSSAWAAMIWCNHHHWTRSVNPRVREMLAPTSPRRE